jgi:cullin-associated NEDD8-dissociated protein 1
MLSHDWALVGPYSCVLFRFMALNDLMNEISRDPSTFQGDESVELKTLEHVMKLIEDTISEVKNIAVQW